jgi:Response regulator containing a CheY-like receiver domain and an HTH DNA-binding domain
MPNTVLIVDDSDVLRRVLKEFLAKHAGADVFDEATDGRQAIVRVQASKPDLIILDLSMPGMGGYKAAAELKKLAPDVPILLFTMHDARPEDVGVDAVVSKVEGLGHLAERVRSFLYRDRPPSLSAIV